MRASLPKLTEREHVVAANRPREGFLFSMPAQGCRGAEERRRTLRERCGARRVLVVGTGQPAVMWCNLNDEGDLLESLVPGAIQVSGSDTDDAKEEKLPRSPAAKRVLVIKPVIGA